MTNVYSRSNLGVGEEKMPMKFRVELLIGEAELYMRSQDVGILNWWLKQQSQERPPRLLNTFSSGETLKNLRDHPLI